MSAPEVPTYADDIAPLINGHCAECHRPEGSGPFSLLGFDNARRRARQISEVVRDRFMPPWKPESGYGPKLLGERHQDARGIELLNAWYASGAPPGDLAQAPAAREFSDVWRLGTPDLVLEFSEQYVLQAEGRDVYRNFVLPIPIEVTKQVRAVEFLPGARLAIHHVLMLADATPRSRERDAAEPGPGYDGMGIGSAEYPAGHVIGWTPGQVPFEAYPGAWWTIGPGSDLVLQMHLLPTGKPERIAPRIGLYFTDEPRTRTTGIVLLRELELDIPAGEAKHIVEQSITLPVATRVLGMYPHAHYIGKDLQIFARLPDGEIRGLLRIPDWDFNWQSDYRFAEPEPLPAGAELVMRYTYDNSAANPRNPFNPPRKMRTGWSSTDEMAELAVQVLLDGPGDFERLQEAQLEYDIRSAGGLARYSYNLGSHFERQGENDRALRAFRTAIREDPAFASAHYKIGALLERAGEGPGAAAEFREALVYQPELIPPRLGLARASFEAGDTDGARARLEGILVDEPAHLETRLYLARLLDAGNDAAGAERVLREGLGMHADEPILHLELGKLLERLGDVRGAREHLGFAASHELPGADAAMQADASRLQAEAWFSLGQLHQRMGDTITAEENFSACLARYPRHLEALLASAGIALDAREDDRAVERLDGVVALSRDLNLSGKDMLGAVPFPAGAFALADAAARARDAGMASDILKAGRERAEEMGKRLWADRFAARLKDLAVAPGAVSKPNR